MLSNVRNYISNGGKYLEVKEGNNTFIFQGKRMYHKYNLDSGLNYMSKQKYNKTLKQCKEMLV